MPGRVTVHLAGTCPNGHQVTGSTTAAAGSGSVAYSVACSTCGAATVIAGTAS